MIKHAMLFYIKVISSLLLISLPSIMSFMTTSHYSGYNDFVSYSLYSYLFNYLYIPKKHNYLTFTNSQSLPSNVFISLWILHFIFAVPLLGALLEVIFFNCHICVCWLLIIFSNLMSLGHLSMSNIEPTRFYFILPTTWEIFYSSMRGLMNLVC